MTHNLIDSEGCEEYGRFSRRRFLSTTSALAAAATTAPAWFPRVAFGSGSRGSRDTLVSVFLCGGMDSLTAVVPYGDLPLYAARPNLAIAPPGQTNGAVDLDGFFGLCPAMPPLITPWNAGELAIVHAVGSTDPSRSHFEAMGLIQKGTPNQPISTLNSGWLGRHLQTTFPMGAGDLRGLAIDFILPQILAEGPSTLAISDPSSFVFPGRSTTAAARRATLLAMHESAPSPMDMAAISSLATIDLLAALDFDAYMPANGASYPNSPFGTALKQTAAMIKGDTDIEVAHIDIDGWDHHNQLGPLTGILATKLDDFARALEAFHLDMLGDSHGTILIVQSEFGRRVAENGSAGLDHGHGGAMFVMGPSVNGGRVYGTWPGLAPENLNNGDLDVTTDYRDVAAEILAVRLGNTNLDQVFPNHTPNFLGLVN